MVGISGVNPLLVQKTHSDLRVFVKQTTKLQWQLHLLFDYFVVKVEQEANGFLLVFNDGN